VSAITPVQTTRDGLLAAICAHPDEDTPRLVYADWLDEYGDAVDRARAEFIRVGCGLLSDKCARCAGEGRVGQHWDPASDTMRGEGFQVR
jgi:uncharacterized protein (TIGR02996 family)